MLLLPMSLAFMLGVVFLVGGRSAATGIRVSDTTAGLAIFAWVGLVEFVRRRYIPTLARLGMLGAGEPARFPLDEPEELDLADDAERAALAAAREDEAAVAALPDWVCPACREPNPGSFDICWKCQAEKPQPDG